MTRSRESIKEKKKSGFTIIEVMLFLGISGLLLVGVLGGTYSAIGIQRYNDSLRSFAEFFRQTYAEVISPETLGAGNSNAEAVYGKLLVFGLEGNSVPNTIYSATIVGDVKIPNGEDSFMNELKAVDAHLFCGNENHVTTLSSYIPLWESRVMTPPKDSNKPFTGSIIIARSPASGTVHTAYSTDTFDLKNHCDAEKNNTSASTNFREYIKNDPGKFSTKNDIDFCLRSENSNIIRDVRLESDGRNTSAVSIIEADAGDSKCR